MALRGFLQRRHHVRELLIRVVHLQHAEAQLLRRRIRQRRLALAPVDQKRGALRGIVDPVVIFESISPPFRYPPKTSSRTRSSAASSSARSWNTCGSTTATNPSGQIEARRDAARRPRSTPQFIAPHAQTARLSRTRSVRWARRLRTQRIGLSDPNEAAKLPRNRSQRTKFVGAQRSMRGRERAKRRRQARRDRAEREGGSGNPSRAIAASFHWRA